MKPFLLAIFFALAFALALGCTANGQSVSPPGGEIEHIGPLGANTKPSGSPPLQAPALTAAQKAVIFDAVMLDKSKSKVNENFDVTVGGLVPTIDLHQLPADVLAQAPTARPYRYAVLADRVVLVDPTTMRAVDVIKP
jgi:hypothetical protein